MSLKILSKVKILNFTKMIAKHSRRVSKCPGMFFELPRHVFDDFWPPYKISRKIIFESKNAQKSVLSPFGAQKPRKNVILSQLCEFFVKKIGWSYDQSLSGGQCTCMFATFHPSVRRDFFYLQIRFDVLTTQFWAQLWFTFTIFSELFSLVKT